MEVRYIIGHGTAERVQETTALPHRVLEIEPDDDVTVYIERPSDPGSEGQIVHMISAAEMRFIAREYRSEMRRRAWARFLGRD